MSSNETTEMCERVPEAEMSSFHSEIRLIHAWSTFTFCLALTLAVSVMAGWGWFFATSGIVYGSFTAVGCVVLVVYKIYSTKMEQQKFRAEIDHYAQFVGEYHTAVSQDTVPKQNENSLEVYSQTVWTPATATNCLDYRRNCSENVSATSLYGDDQQSQRAESPSPLATGKESITSWSIYDEDRQQFTSINSTPFSVVNWDNGGESSSSSSSYSSPETNTLSSPPITPPNAVVHNMYHNTRRPTLTLSTKVLPPKSSSWDVTPSTATTMSAYSPADSLTPYTATDYSPATSIASSFSAERMEEEDCCGSPVGRASFETVGLGAGSPLRNEITADSYRYYQRRESGDAEYWDEDEGEQQWQGSMTRMTKKMSSAVQAMFVKGTGDGEARQVRGDEHVRECLEV